LTKVYQIVFIERAEILDDNAVFCLSIALSIFEYIRNRSPKSGVLLITHEPLYLVWYYI